MSEEIYLCEAGDIKEGKLSSFDIEDVKIMVTQHNGKYIAASRICTHKTFDLTQGHYADGFVTCTLHTSTFDIESGEPLNPPAMTPIDVFTVVEKEGKLYIKL